MRDVPLGTLVFRAGLVAEEQLQDALLEHMRSGKRLGEVLLERGWLHERDLGRLLAGQKGLPFVEVSAADAEAEALELLPEENARLQIALPLRREEGELVVAVADPSNELVLESLRRALGFEPRLVVAPLGELVCAIGEAYGAITPTAPPGEPEPAPETQVEDVPPAVVALPTAPVPVEEPATEPTVVPPFRPLVPPAAEAVAAEESTAPVPEEGAPVAASQQPAATAARHAVRLRLRDGELIEVGVYDASAEAAARAQDVVRRITAAEGDATWPFFADRFLRPDSIVSIDLVDERASKPDAGSADRTP